MSKHISWGDWIKSRSEVVGFRRQIDLARAVGCTEQQLSRWMGSDTPPPSMRKGFDVALIRELRTDRHTLFVRFAEIAAEAAPVIDNGLDEDSLRRDIINVSLGLRGRGLQVLSATARALRDLPLAS